MLWPLVTSCAKDYKVHSLVQTSFTELPNSLVVIFHLWPLCIEWHFPFSPKETFSWLHQIQPQNISFVETVDVSYFSLTLLFSTAVSPVWFKLGLQIAYSVLVIFWLTRRSGVREKMRFGASYSTSNKSDTFWLRASKNAFKVGRVKFANSLSSPSIVKKVCTGSKSS